MFKIFSGSNAIMEKQMHKEISKIAARDIMKARSGHEQQKATDTWWKSRVNPIEAAKNARMYQKQYERTLPETLAPQTKNEMWKRAKQLKDEFVMGMLSREELHPTKGFLENGTMKHVVDEERMRSNRSVEREHAWQTKNNNKIAEFKNLMRHLNPDDPNAGDVEKYRPRDKRN